MATSIEHVIRAAAGALLKGGLSPEQVSQTFLLFGAQMMKETGYNIADMKVLIDEIFGDRENSLAAMEPEGSA